MKRVFVIVSLICLAACVDDRRVAYSGCSEAEMRKASQDWYERIQKCYDKFAMDPRNILKVKIVYTPAEEPYHWLGERFLQIPEMDALVGFVEDDEEDVPQDVILKMLDKVDWIRGGALAVALLNRKEMTTQLRERMTSKVLPLVGQVNNDYLAEYFRNPLTPTDTLTQVLSLKRVPISLRIVIREVLEQRRIKTEYGETGEAIPGAM